VEFAARAGNENAAGGAAFAVLHPLYNARRLAAFRAIGALRGVHNLLTVCSLCDLRHVSPSIWAILFHQRAFEPELVRITDVETSFEVNVILAVDR
jgi:hypothetical protein